MRLKNNLKVLTTPSCWIRNGPTCKAWDKELNRLLDTQEVYLGVKSVLADMYYTIVVGDTEVWGGNYPYDYGSRHKTTTKFKALPSRVTVFRLREAELAARAEL